MQEFDLSLNEGMLLCTLLNTPKLTSSEIAEALGLSASNASKIIRSVEEKKLITRLVGKADKRQMHFALYARTQSGWMKQYFAFVNFLKKGRNGWLDISFPQLDLTLRVKYADCTKFTPLTYLWKEGVHAGKFKVKFREPVPVI